MKIELTEKEIKNLIIEKLSLQGLKVNDLIRDIVFGRQKLSNGQDGFIYATVYINREPKEKTNVTQT